jgi:hypothetical protein
MITEKELLDYGFIKTDDPIYPYTKVLSVTIKEEYRNDDEGEILLALSTEYNPPEFVLNTGYEVEVVLNIQSIEDLTNIERMIAGTRTLY